MNIKECVIGQRVSFIEDGQKIFGNIYSMDSGFGTEHKVVTIERDDGALGLGAPIVNAPYNGCYGYLVDIMVLKKEKTRKSDNARAIKIIERVLR